MVKKHSLFGVPVRTITRVKKFIPFRRRPPMGVPPVWLPMQIHSIARTILVVVTIFLQTSSFQLRFEKGAWRKGILNLGHESSFSGLGLVLALEDQYLTKKPKLWSFRMLSSIEWHFWYFSVRDSVFPAIFFFALRC